MELLYDETYTSSDGKRTSRNIWYGNADMTFEGQYGKEIKLTNDLKADICNQIKNDLSNNQNKPVTETNWYFYGNGVTVDLIGSCILPAVMIRERNGEFICNISIRDHDFAVNLDTILAFKLDLTNYLMIGEN